MDSGTLSTNTDRYARAIVASKRARWDIDADVIRGRSFDPSQKFLPDGLSLARELEFLSERELRLVSQVQGRTYANLFGLIERFITAEVLEVSQRHVLGNQTALEALVRFTDEELKHQELFRRIEALAAPAMPSGYRLLLDPNEVASTVLGKSKWSVLALTSLIELYTQTHYKESIGPDAALSPLFKDVFRFHWMEESQHAVLDELEWRAEDAKLEAEERDRGVSDLIDLVAAVDGLLRTQSLSDASYFIANGDRVFDPAQQARIEATFLKAYRYQYILSGVQSTRFAEVLRSLVDESQFARVVAALETLS